MNSLVKVVSENSYSTLSNRGSSELFAVPQSIKVSNVQSVLATSSSMVPEVRSESFRVRSRYERILTSGDFDGFARKRREASRQQGLRLEGPRS